MKVIKMFCTVFLLIFIVPSVVSAQELEDKEAFSSEYLGILEAINGYADEDIHESIREYLSSHPSLLAFVEENRDRQISQGSDVITPHLIGQKTLYSMEGKELSEKRVLLYDSGIYAILQLTGREENNPIQPMSTHYKTGTAVKTLYHLGLTTKEKNKNVPIAKMRLVSTFGYDGRNVWATSIDGQNQLLVPIVREAWKYTKSEYTDGHRNVFRTINDSGFQATTGGIVGKMIIEKYELRLSCNMQGKLFTNGDALA